jgi:hypothetical protein
VPYDFQLTPETVLLLVNAYWQFIDGFPFFRSWPACAVCRSTLRVDGTPYHALVYSRWNFHPAKRGSTFPLRCDVITKCPRCSRTQPFGVVMPPDVTPERKGSWTIHEVRALQPDDASPRRK